jgi:replicative DNA helicase
MIKIPFSLETEKQVLLTLINNPNHLLDIHDLLSIKDFYDERSKKVYQALLILHKNNRTITEATLYEEINKQDKDFDITFIIDSYYGDDVTLNQSINYLKQLAIRRNLLEKIRLLESLLVQEKNHENVLEDIGKSLFDLTLKTTTSEHISSHIMNAFDTIEQRLTGHGIIKTGFEELDRRTAGFFPGQLIVIAARTSIGKTSFALSLAHNVMGFGKKVMFMSLEMPNHEIAIKSISIESGVDYRDIIGGAHLDPRFHDDIVQASERVNQFPIVLEDACYSLNDIKAAIRKEKKTNDINLVIIDYLGLIHSERYKDNKVLEIGYITRSLKLFAKELQIPIVILAQINRESENASDKIPKLHHLKDSGSIEQDADMVLFIYRQHYYDEYADPYCAKIIIAKNRLGPTNNFDIHYQPGTMHFRDKR